MGDFNLLIFQLAVLLMSVVIHEVSHGVVALWQGDPTAKLLGRLTLNPIKHLDVWGSFLVPLGLFIFSGGSFLFGWAKPVPYNPHNLRNQRWGPSIVGLAGPASNLLIALVFGFSLRFISFASEITLVQNLVHIFVIIVSLNILLAVFNLLPIPPLDGSHVLFSFLPRSLDRVKLFLAQYGMFILLFIIFFFFSFVALFSLFLLFLFLFVR